MNLEEAEQYFTYGSGSKPVEIEESKTDEGLTECENNYFYGVKDLIDKGMTRAEAVHEIAEQYDKTYAAVSSTLGTIRRRKGLSL